MNQVKPRIVLAVGILLSVGAGAILLSRTAGTQTAPPTQPQPIPATACPTCIQTQSPESIESLPSVQVSKVVAGTSYTFQSSDTTNPVSPASWKAKYGTVTTEGTYTAPTWRLPYGEDLVTFKMSDGSDGDLRITVVPNETIPSSYIAKWMRPTGTLDPTSKLTIFEVAYEDGRTGDSGTILELEAQDLTFLPIYENGEMTITMAAQIDGIKKFFGVSVERGVTIPITRYANFFLREQSCDLYKCVNGNLIYIGTSNCIQVLTERYNSPTYTI